MKIEGIKGCYDKTRSLFYFARMCSKIRLHAAGKLPKDYHELLGAVDEVDGPQCVDVALQPLALLTVTL